jgi:hypothetical protein
MWCCEWALTVCLHVYRGYMSCLPKRALIDMQRRRHSAPAGARVPACGANNIELLTADCLFQSEGGSGRAAATE